MARRRLARTGGSILYVPPDEAFGMDEFVYIVDGIYPAQVTIRSLRRSSPIRSRSSSDSQAIFHVLANDPFWAGYSGERRITHVLDVDPDATATISSDGRSAIYRPGGNLCVGFLPIRRGRGL